MLLAPRTLVNWPRCLFSELACEERWVTWEICHQMSWVWLKGSEAGPLHPATSRGEKNVITKLLLAQRRPSQDSGFSSCELLNLRGCIIYMKIRCDTTLSLQFGTEVTDKLENQRDREHHPFALCARVVSEEIIPIDKTLASITKIKSNFTVVFQFESSIH